MSSVILKKDSFLLPKEMSFWTWQGLQDVGLRFDSARLIYKQNQRKMCSVHLNHQTQYSRRYQWESIKILTTRYMQPKCMILGRSY